MKSLNLLLEEYKELTLKLMSDIEEVDKLDKLLDDRQKLLDEIEVINVDKKAFTIMAKELNLIELEEELKNKLEDQRIKVRKDLDTLRRQRQSNKSYVTINREINFFDKTT